MTGMARNASANATVHAGFMYFLHKLFDNTKSVHASQNLTVKKKNNIVPRYNKAFRQCIFMYAASDFLQLSEKLESRLGGGAEAGARSLAGG
jgi:hypothetical protein